MNPAPRLGLIINTWNQPEYLDRVLHAVSNQSSAPDEVLLADDGSDDQTRQVFAKWGSRQTAPALHVWQEHVGFRRSRILNQTIARAGSAYLVFLDGDTLPHPEFISDHRLLAQKQQFIQGHRALVTQRAAAWFGMHSFKEDRRRALWTGNLRGLKHAFRWPRPWRRHREDVRGVRGCNLGIWREDLIRVNGYNEEFFGWGREDSELAVRLINVGVRRVDARGWALCFHLWHPPASRNSLAANDELLAEAQRTGATRCQLGLEQYLSASNR